MHAQWFHFCLLIAVERHRWDDDGVHAGNTTSATHIYIVRCLIVLASEDRIKINQLAPGDVKRCGGGGDVQLKAARSANVKRL